MKGNNELYSVLVDKMFMKANSSSYHFALKLQKLLKEKMMKNVDLSVINNDFIKKLEDIIKEAIKEFLEKGDKSLDSISELFDVSNEEYGSLINEFLLQIDDDKLALELAKDEDLLELAKDYLLELKDDFSESLEEIRKSSAVEYEEEDFVFDVDNMPSDLEDSFRKIFDYSGYNITRDDTHFYVQNKLSGKRDKIIFYKDFNYCFFEGEPNNKVYINVSLTNGNLSFGNESLSSIDGIELYYNEDKREVIIRNSTEDISYQVGVNKDNKLILIKMRDNEIIAESYQSIIKEVERLVPGFLYQFKKDNAVKEMSNSEINGSMAEEEMREKDQQIEDHVENKEAFEAALDAQRKKDLIDAQKRIEKSNSLVLSLDGE